MGYLGVYVICKFEISRIRTNAHFNYYVSALQFKNVYF